MTNCCITQGLNDWQFLDWSVYSKALCSKEISVNCYGHDYMIITIKTKQLIAIIIVSFDNNKRVNCNKNDHNGDYNKQVLIASFAISKF